MTASIAVKPWGARRTRRTFAALLAAVSMVGFGAMTASAAKPADPGSKGKGHNKGVVTAPAPAPTSAATGANGPGAGNITVPNKTGPKDNNRGDTWLQTVGPCPDHNAEVLNHDADAMSGCNLATGGNPAFEPPSEPVAENLQYAEIGSVESTNPDHNPHLPCANIEVMGKDMADATGSYSIDYWPPTGNKGGVYGKNSDGSSALSLPAMINGDADVTNNGTWKYTATPTTVSKQGKTGGYQVMDIIDVSALVHNAKLINPDPHDIQGYHFKLQMTQDPQKHKTFWVKCGDPVNPQHDCDGDTDGSKASDSDCTTPSTDCDGDTDGSKASDSDCTTPSTDCDGDSDGSKVTDADCTTPTRDCDGDTDGSKSTEADCKTPPGQLDCDSDSDGTLSTDAACAPGGGGGTNPVSSVQGASTSSPSGGVLGASITSPITGHPVLSALVSAALLIVVGAALLVTNRRKGKVTD